MDLLKDALAGNSYPGRGVLWCTVGDGTRVGGYFLTGRSAASQARTLRLTPEGELVVAPSDVREHDSLRHYVAARLGGERLVFGNGEQVSTVADRLDDGLAPLLALDGLDYEPDPPIFTPRLTVIADGGERGQAWLGAARRSAGARTTTDRLTLGVSDLAPGEGVLMTTYSSRGSQIATGVPFTEVRTTARTRHDLLDEIWSALPPQLRVAAAVFTPGDLPNAEIRQA
ncbi:IMP cyclohydrolase [Streptomyces sp. NPDC047072]|uniref:IMP cyclohydrolase n=1 Tax=Streptomyces sp. NPDC047072 TaxID=3154809 RepID=UPI0033E67BEB